MPLQQILQRYILSNLNIIGKVCFFRLLNIFTHVIEENVPGPPQMKPTLPSLPNAPSLSPIKRKSKVENSPGGATTTPDKSTPQKQTKGKLYIFINVSNAKWVEMAI